MKSLYGLYAVTNGARAGTTLVDHVDAALRGGARIVQYRDKGTDARRRQDEARKLRTLCDAAGALLIVNDDIELAAHIGADGVHLGQHDAAIDAARIVLGAMAVIGVSCHDSIELAHAAAAMGADYVAFGSFFPSPTKPDATRAPVELITHAKRELEVPVCAIGGITPDNGDDIVAAGADMVAVVSGLYDAQDVESEARRYAALFEP